MSSFHSPRQSQNQFSYNPATPPPPPPKPTAQSSGTVTPLAGPPRPPPPPGQDGGQDRSYYPGAHGGGQQQQSYVQPTSGVEPPHEGWLPDVVKDKTSTDLQSLLDDPSLQQALLHNPSTSHPSIAASAATLKPLLADNLAVANTLKSLEAQIQALREATQSRLLTMRALERQFRAKEQEQDKAMEDFSARVLYQKLVGSITEQESLCQGLEESFMEGGEEGAAPDREVEQFVKRLKEARKIAYLRKERKERWDEGRVGGWR